VVVTAAVKTRTVSSAATRRSPNDRPPEGDHKMPQSSLPGHAVVALGLLAIFAAAPDDPAAEPPPAPPLGATAVMAAIQPFDEQFFPTPYEADTGAPALMQAAMPPEAAFGLFEA
jgi:hypothetical protein